MKKRLVIGLSGASGAPLGIELLRGMQYFPDWETHLVYSSSFVKTLAYESSLSLEDVCHLADQVYPLDDVAASVSSGTFRTEGMVIIPCSMKTLAGIACGYSERAAQACPRHTRNPAQSDTSAQYAVTDSNRCSDPSAHAHIL